MAEQANEFGEELIQEKSVSNTRKKFNRSRHVLFIQMPAYEALGNTWRGAICASVRPNIPEQSLGDLGRFLEGFGTFKFFACEDSPFDVRIVIFVGP